jgi:imidazolonepropionase
MPLLINASQVLTLSGGPQRGSDLGNLNIIQDGAVIFQNEQILEVGSRSDLIRRYPNEPLLDAGGKVVMPGFVDPHTHLVWAGDRAAEFEMRLQGKTYMEILAAGGGILSTVKATRSASAVDLLNQTHKRAKSLFQYGTTTAEVKTGYGLSTQSEIAQLEAIRNLNILGPLQVVPTFLGAHAIAPEYKDQPGLYTRIVADEMLPAVVAWWRENAADQPLPFVDVFCENGAFNLEQSRQILESAKNMGFPLKIHVDEFENLGGASMAAELGAVSADHLVKTSAADITRLSQSNTVAVSLPCTPFGLADPQYTPAKEILAAGGLLALATDCNPGTAWCESMQFVIALACRHLKLTPAQAITATTINAAAAIKLQDQIGSLEPGKQADMLILTVDDYRHLGYRFGTNLVHQIIKKGKVYTNPSWN